MCKYILTLFLVLFLFSTRLLASAENVAEVQRAESDQELISALPKENEVEGRKWTTKLPPIPEERAEVDVRKWTTKLPPIPEERAEVDVRKWTTKLPPIPEERVEVESRKWTTKLPPIPEERVEVESRKWTTKLPPIPEEKLSMSSVIEESSASISPTSVPEDIASTETALDNENDNNKEEATNMPEISEEEEEGSIADSAMPPSHSPPSNGVIANNKPKPKPRPSPKPKPTKKPKTPRPTKPHRTTRPHTRKPTTTRRPKTTRGPHTRTTPHHQRSTSHPHTTKPPHTTTSKPYPTPLPSKHHPMVLALQWPITFGKNKPNGVDKSKMVTKWTMHGIWPDSVSKCNPHYPFNETEMAASLRADLQSLWPNFNKGKADADFWKHEWVEHGTCTGWTIEGYFSKGKELWHRYPVTEWLNSAGIIPSNNPNATYGLAAIEAALQKELRSTDSVAVNCLKKQVRGGGWESWLWEVYICLDHTGDVLHKCAKKSNKSNCVDPIHYYESF